MEQNYFKDFDRRIASAENQHIQTLWEQYNSDHTDASLSKLFLACECLIDQVVKANIPGSLSGNMRQELIDDSVSEAKIRFMKLVESYGNGKYEDGHALFTTALGEHVAGATKDVMRRNAKFTNGMSRTSLDRSTSIKKIEEIIGQSSTHEIAQYILDTPEILNESAWSKETPWKIKGLEKEIANIKTLQASTLSLHTPNSEDENGTCFIDTISSDVNQINTIESAHLDNITPSLSQYNITESISAEFLEKLFEISEAMKLLPKGREKAVIQQLVFERKKSLDVAESLGVSESRISQIKKSAFKKINTIRLRDDFQDLINQDKPLLIRSRVTAPTIENIVPNIQTTSNNLSTTFKDINDEVEAETQTATSPQEASNDPFIPASGWNDLKAS